MTTFKHVHSSSRFDRSVESLKKATEKYYSDASIVTFTEVQSEAREDAIRAVGGKDWWLVAGDETPNNDCAIAFDKRVWKKVYAEQFKSSELTFWKTGGRKSQHNYSTIAVLEHRESKKRVAILVIHLPSSVEGDIRTKKDTPRTLAWVSMFFNTRKRLNKIAKAEEADASMYVADFNINFKQLWFRAILKVLAPGYKSTWNDLGFSGGTHHSRVIDGTLLRGRIKVRGSATLYADDSSSDHRPYQEALILL